MIGTRLSRPLVCSIISLSLLLAAPLVWAHENMGGNPLGDSPLPTNCLPVDGLTPFLDRLPIPSNAVPARIRAAFALPWNPNLVFTNVPEYDMPMTSFNHRFHRDLPEVEVWGYSGSYPGPTIQATTNAPVIVNWINDLPPSYTNTTWLRANTSFHGTTNQDVRVVVHLHGAATLPRYDGYPTNDFKSGFYDTYLYNNIDFDGDGETLWYHDHAVGLTANNVYAGLEGFYLLRSPGFEAGLDLPRGDYEIPLVLQDRDIQTNCPPASLLYQGGVHPYHNLGVVNGVVSPYCDVEPRPYRFRVLNGANQRTFSIGLVSTNGGSRTNLPIYVIGNEDGFLQQTAKVTQVNLMPGERIDLILDFTAFGGTNLLLVNSTNKNDLEPGAPQVTNLVQFRVILPAKGTNPIPGVIIPANEWTATTNMVQEATVTREITLDLMNEIPFPGYPFLSFTNYPFALMNLSFFDDPITEKPRAGETEIWSFINLSPDAHPIHVHLLDFRVVDRTRFRGDFFADNQVKFFTNPPAGVTDYINDRFNKSLRPLDTYLTTNQSLPGFTTAQPFEAGPKDVVRVAPYSVTRIVMTWPTNEIFYTSPSAVNLDPATAGRYIYHCHLLEHEDNDMMRPLQVLAPAPPLNLGLVPDATVNPYGDNQFLLSLEGTLPTDNYRFETATDLATGPWVPFLRDVTGTPGVILIRPPSSTNQVQLYRANPFTVLHPPPAAPAPMESMDHP